MNALTNTEARELLRAHIRERLGEEPEGLDRVLAAFAYVPARKNMVLIEQGTICREVYFILEGCLRLSTLDRNFSEKVTHLAFEGEWVTAMRCVVYQTPGNERVVAAESGHLLRIRRDDFQRFSAELPPFEAIYKAILEESYTASIERIQTLMTLDALERVRWLLQERPRIFTRLSNRLIASYLGISEATLSRLKGKL